MADNYVLCAFSFELNEKEQIAAVIAGGLIGQVYESGEYAEDGPIEALESLVDAQVVIHKEGLEGFTEADYEDAKMITAHYFQFYPDALDQLDFVLDSVRDGIHLSHDESMNIDAALSFTKAVLVTFDSDLPVVVEWAETCSRPRSGEFGGGAAIVTKEGIETLNTFDWIERQLQARKNSTPEAA